MFSYGSTSKGDRLGLTQIRLLHLLPAKDQHNQIECRLEVVALEEDPVYEALSYCWGDNSQLQGIKCNNEAFQVTESLFCALQHLRNDHLERTLWIDAICINQKDLEERRFQVKLMKDIYTRSQRVVIWLGPDPVSDGVDHLFEMVQKISNLPDPRLSTRERTFFEMNVFDADRWHQHEDPISPKVPDQINNDFVIPQKATKGAIAVLTRQWWTRTWTVQEMVLAPSAIIMCGHLAAPASDIRRTCDCVLMHAVSDAFDTGDDDDLLSFGDLFDDPNGTLYMATMRLRRSVSEKMELGKLLRFLRWLGAKDPRDKIYGSLGIAASTYGIEPDYTISTVECYTRATFSIISGSQSLDIFSALRKPSCIETTLEDLPSWVPDWSYDFSSVPDKEKGPSGINNPIIRENVRTPIMLEMAGAFPEWKASGSNMPFKARLSSDCKTLILKGIILEELNRVGNKLEYPWAGPELQSENVIKDSIYDFRRNWRIYNSIGAAMDTIKGWQDLAFGNENLQTVSDETQMDAFLTTLLSNRIRLSADRRKVLDYLQKSIETSFRMSRSGAIMNQLHLPHVAPKLYHKLLGFGKICSIDDDEVLSFGKSFTDVQLAFDQRMATTCSGYLSLVPWSARAGDRIALLRGGRTPYVLRKAGEKWKILGDCYVHGIMSGEAWSDGKCVDIEIV
ncbi:heterokaryon incompatibility (het-6OR allele) [Fusarium sp. NRRL 52700]|nr:heterokaryon incompatibility (het-6OR allele) [Fusarium sp. NRRL 52700]